MLVAVGRTRVDYFSLDVEGSEYKILTTIPWHKVDIKVSHFQWAILYTSIWYYIL
jgi:hypothetical protein